MQFATASNGDALSIADMGRDAPDDQQIGSGIAEESHTQFLARISGADGAMSGKRAD